MTTATQKDILYDEEKIDTGAANVYFEKALTGTVTVDASTKAVTGVGTAFDDELEIGQTIFVVDKTSGTEHEMKVKTVTSATAATVDDAPAPADCAAGSSASALYNVGGIQGGVDVSTETTTYETTIDQLGDTPISERIKGRKVTVTVPMAEISEENWARAIADAVGYKTSGGKTLFRATPSIGYDVIAGASRKLRIVPLFGDTETEDLSKILTFWKAGPTAGTVTMKFQIGTPRPINAVFRVYYDPSHGDFYYVGDYSIK